MIFADADTVVDADGLVVPDPPGGGPGGRRSGADFARVVRLFLLLLWMLLLLLVLEGARSSGVDLDMLVLAGDLDRTRRPMGGGGLGLPLGGMFELIGACFWLEGNSTDFIIDGTIRISGISCISLFFQGIQPLFWYVVRLFYSYRSCYSVLNLELICGLEDFFHHGGCFG